MSGDRFKCRVLQAKAIVKLYEQANAQRPSSMDELEAWTEVNLHDALGPECTIDPHRILTEEEINRVYLSPKTMADIILTGNLINW